MFATALGAGDRAALQSLIPLASGLGAGTIFGLFFVGRRRAGFAVFEAITIVAVLVAVSTTAYYCIALLHRDTAVSNKELVETALPLDVWRRGAAAFIDGPAAKRLRETVDARWQSLAAGEARGAIGPFVLLEVESTGGRRGGTPTELRLDTLRPGTATPRRTARLRPNGDGLFDVTDLVA